MTKKHDNTEMYEKQFSALLKEALEEDAAKIELAEMDFSFMDEIIPDGFETKKKPAWRRFATVAAIVVCFFIAVSGMAIWINSEPAMAFKARMEKVIYMIKDSLVFTSDEDLTYTDENTMSITIDKWEDIDKAQNLILELPIPNYIPDGYTFKSLTVDKYSDETYYAVYEYVHEDSDNIYMSIYHEAQSDGLTTTVNNIVDTTKLEDRMIYIAKDDVENIYTVYIFFDDSVVYIIGMNDIEEMKLVAENII